MFSIGRKKNWFYSCERNDLGRSVDKGRMHQLCDTHYSIILYHVLSPITDNFFPFFLANFFSSFSSSVVFMPTSNIDLCLLFYWKSFIPFPFRIFSSNLNFYLTAVIQFLSSMFRVLVSMLLLQLFCRKKALNKNKNWLTNQKYWRHCKIFLTTY